MAKEKSPLLQGYGKSKEEKERYYRRIINILTRIIKRGIKMTKVEIDIREIKEDLKDIKNTLAKMQEAIKRIEDNYPTAYQYGTGLPFPFSVPSTQACSGYGSGINKV
jgi:chromosome segregation ATPase